jgi:hypothetical protein
LNYWYRRLLAGRGVTEHDVREPRFKHCFAIPLGKYVFLFFCQSQPHDVPLIAITEEYRYQHSIFVMLLVVFCCLSEVQMSSAAVMVYYSFNNQAVHWNMLSAVPYYELLGFNTIDTNISDYNIVRLADFCLEDVHGISL